MSSYLTLIALAILGLVVIIGLLLFASGFSVSPEEEFLPPTPYFVENDPEYSPGHIDTAPVP